LADLTKIQAELVKERLKTYPDFIVGLKARLSRTVIGKNGIVPLQLAKKFKKKMKICL
jgi:dihydroorotase